MKNSFAFFLVWFGDATVAATPHSTPNAYRSVIIKSVHYMRYVCSAHSVCYCGMQSLSIHSERTDVA
uniref:Putative secreted protein n=1 Tax=Anopheles darlingi TaxID=43151 RepID=A0A2M4DRS1_ANODA